MDKEELSRLLKFAIEGNLKLDEVESYGKKTNLDAVERLVVSDLIDAVQHTPFFPLRKILDKQTWESQFERAVLKCDLALLHAVNSAEEWLNSRQKLISSFHEYTDEKVDSAIQREILNLGSGSS